MPTPTNSTAILDNRASIAQLDKSNMLGSIEALADQVRHAWQSLQAIEFQPKAEIRNVVVAAMGGSALGGDVAKHLFKDRLTVPYEVVNSYTLPGYVNEHSLVVLASYSGSTEEILSCADQAKAAGAQVMYLCAGGKLAEFGTTNNYPGYIIKPDFNPSNQPRMAIGYAIVGLLGMLSKAGVCSLSQTEIDEVLTTILRVNEEINVDVPQADNLAKLVAFQCLERRPIFIASEFLSGAVHVSTNQFNENAKIFADYKLIPELNHHLMEGLRFPKSNPLNHLFLFINSDLYAPSIQKRMALTQQVVEQNELETYEVKLTAETKLTQMFELITVMAYAGFYLTMLEGIDPSPIPFVDWFKDELK